VLPFLDVVVGAVVVVGGGMAGRKKEHGLNHVQNQSGGNRKGSYPVVDVRRGRVD